MMKMFKREKIIDFFFMREKIRKTSFQLNISMNVHQNLLFKLLLKTAETEDRGSVIGGLRALIAM